MKKSLLTLVFVAIAALGFARAPFVNVYLKGCTYAPKHQSTIELDDLAEADSLLISQDENDSISYTIESAQFIFAPWRGTAYLISFRGPALPRKAQEILKTIAKPGDRILIDKIRARVKNGPLVTLVPFVCQVLKDGKFIKPDETPHTLTFSEDSVASEQLYFGGEIFSVDHIQPSLSADLHWPDTISVNNVTVLGPITGELKFFNHKGELISKAEYDTGSIIRKEYYFEGSEPPKIRRTMVRVNHYYYKESHYDEEGYLVAEGTVAYVGLQPCLMSLKPRGFEKSPFEPLNLEGEFRPDGTWKVYDRRGEVSDSFVLVLNGNARQSVKMNGTTTQGKISGKKKGLNFGVNKRRQKKHKKLIVPSF